MIDLQALGDFLYRARMAGYAAEPDNDPDTSRVKREYNSIWQLWEHDDKAMAETGDGNVIGREIISYDKQAVWGMTYYGVVLQPDVDTLALYTFLRQAMRAVNPKNMPARGQQKFANGDFVYSYDLSGTLLEFTGVERVLRRGEPIYRLYFNGGLLKSRV